jgi:hypothetical protein
MKEGCVSAKIMYYIQMEYQPKEWKNTGQIVNFFPWGMRLEG